MSKELRKHPIEDKEAGVEDDPFDGDPLTTYAMFVCIMGGATLLYTPIDHV